MNNERDVWPKDTIIQLCLTLKEEIGCTQTVILTETKNDFDIYVVAKK